MRLIPAVILCALLGVVYWVGATLFTDRIQNDITERSSEAITPFKPDVDLLVDGRDVTITGLVNTENQREEAKAMVDSVWGVRASRNQLAVRDPYSFNATNKQPDGMIMSGIVDSPEAIDHMKKSIMPVTPAGNVGTTARPMVNSGQKLALGSNALLQLKNGELNIDEDVFLLTGDADYAEVKDRIESELNANQALIDPLLLRTDINVVNSMSLACRTSLNSIVDLDTVLFNVDQAIVADGYKQTISAWSSLLEVCPGVVLLEAHADQDGSEDYNQQLSHKRASAVTQLFVNRGIAKDRVQAFSFGETRPVASNETTGDKVYNRRVDLEYVHTEMLKLNSIQPSIISSQSAE